MSNQVRLFENQIQHQDIKIINKPVKKKMIKIYKIGGINSEQFCSVTINHNQASLNHVDFI